MAGENKNSFFSGETVKIIKGRLIIAIVGIIVLAVGANIKMTYDFKYVPGKISSNAEDIAKLEYDVNKRFSAIIGAISLIEKHAEQLSIQWEKLNDLEQSMGETESKHEGESGKFHEGLENLKCWIADIKKDIREIRQHRGGLN
jgi:hypothetical protein